MCYSGTMETVADLHLHSRYSVATGRQADLPHLDLWGRYKGVTVVGTGDCTHPRWLAELTEQLEEVAPGTYELKPQAALPLDLHGPFWEAVEPVRFLITGEVSTIYKQGGRVRKVHLLMVLSGLEAAQRLSRRLARIGNVAADGRPILGLTAASLTELTLEQDPDALVIPAHIWTPWFSVLGAKSGFDSLEDCFGETLRHIYALETGLSSDPAMNWRVSGLDRFVLVSNSDAHSPEKLGREANLFRVPPTFAALARAIRTGEGFLGTLEFFPEEGKYHLDGHRKCGRRLTPQESRAAGGRCPECGQPLTLGVLNRVLALADREEGSPPPQARPFTSLIGLPEILAEVMAAAPGSKKVRQAYFQLLQRLGPELAILRHGPLEEVAREGGPLLAEALARMRRGEVRIEPGYDGLFGKVHLFTPEEWRRLRGQGAFWSVAPAVSPSPGVPPAAGPAAEVPPGSPAGPPQPLPAPAGLNAAQERAVTRKGGTVVVQAGPGTGKTRALSHRVAHLLASGAPPGSILAITFTRQAAEEMAPRVGQLLPGHPGVGELSVSTFHALGLRLLSEAGLERQVADEALRRQLLQEVARRHGLKPAILERRFSQAKSRPGSPDGEGPQVPPELGPAFRDYEAALAGAGLYDFEDLVARPVRLLDSAPDLRAAWQGRWRHFLVDEFQDLNGAQYRFLLALAGEAPASLLAIGDPNQAIYGFRGASPEFFRRLPATRPDALVMHFPDTYRLPPPLLAASRRVLPPAAQGGAPEVSRRRGEAPLLLLEAATPLGEARAVAGAIEAVVGGFRHHTLPAEHRPAGGAVGFGDIAVLYRLHAQGELLAEELSRAGIPCQLVREGMGPDWEELDLAAARVKLLSLHAAKGLEFDYVFLTGCEDGLIPLKLARDDPPDLEEERRLFYVGLTRAREQVILTRARRRRLAGHQGPTRLSPWVAAVAPQIWRPAAPRGRVRQRSLFPQAAGPPGGPPD
ncbi:MAG: UvrD-helicase domain-containing protein [Syntrophobacterales bacterium]|nr:UvrD-helicase domain-containing protein [Syntrophobacterales bacterium]